MSVKLGLAAAMLVPAWKLRGVLATPGGGRVLMYHAIGTIIPDDVQGRYTLTPERFANQMEFIARSGRRVGVLGRSDTDVAITFDDGYRDNLTHALPVLERLGLPFTIFVAAGFARSGNPLYLSAAELKTLAENPLANIGAHGDSHTRLTELGDFELAVELTRVKSWLEDATGKPVTALSYPHGAVDSRVRAAVAAAGFTLACTSEFGANEAGRDALALRRIDIWNTDDEAKFESKLAGEWDWMRFFSRCGL